MLLGARMALWNGRRSPLPPGARWVEYLESTGTQYINTGVVYSWGQNYEATFSCNKSATVSAVLFGIYGSQVNRQMGFNAYAHWHTSTATAYIYANPYLYTTVPNEAVNTVAFTNGTWYFNGTEKNTSNTIENPTGLMVYAFAANQYNGTPAYFFVGRAYAFKIWDAQGNLVRDYIPVRVGDVGYLYDRVSGQLFGNAGTGAFTYGADLPYPIGG